MQAKLCSLYKNNKEKKPHHHDQIRENDQNDQIQSLTTLSQSLQSPESNLILLAYIFEVGLSLQAPGAMILNILDGIIKK